ncbi:peroxide stress protein YaaA [Streptococcus rifensis]
MKILLPTAKELNTDLPGYQMEALDERTEAIVQTLSFLSSTDLQRHYKIKPEAVEQEADHWSRLAKGQAQSYAAWQLFNGLMYRQMKRENLSDGQIRYLNEHVFITSALYGVINVFEPIAPHRLDFLMGFKVNGQSLKNYWREQYDQAVAEDDLLISLLSNEFETVFSKTTQEKMVKLIFMEERDGQLKTHSTISKKARGKCLNALVDNHVTTVSDIKSLVFEGFRYQADLSKEKELVFVKK